MHRFKDYISVVLSIFTVFCDHPHYLMQNCQLFSTVAAPFTIPQERAGVPVSPLLPALAIFLSFFDYSHPSECESGISFHF